MTTVQPRADEIKRLVVQTFVDLGVQTRYLFQMEEATVVRDGRRVARTYQAADLKAIWLVRKGLIRFVNAEGTTLRVIRLYPKVMAQVAAA